MFKKGLITFLFIVSIGLSAQVKDSTYILSLNQAIDLALKNNIEAKKSEIDIKKAHQKIIETRSIGLPQIKADVDYNYYFQQPVSVLPNIFGDDPNPNENIEVTFGTKQDMSAGVTLTQLIFSGTYIVGLQSAKAFEEIFKLAKDQTAALIKERVVQMYGNALVIDENIEIIDKNLEIANKNLYETTQTYKAGFLEEQDVEQLQLSVNQLKKNKSFALSQKEVILASLKLYLGITQDSTLSLSTSFDELSSPDFLFAGSDMLDGSIEDNINYKLSLNNVKTKKIQLKYEKSFALPQLAGFLNYQQKRYSDNFPLFVSGDTNWNPISLMGFQLDVPIFSSFQRKAKVAQANLEIEKAEAEHANLTESLKFNIKQKKVDYENAVQELKLAKESRELSERIYKKESVKYKEGLTTSFNLSQIERQKYLADSEYIAAALEVIQKKNQLLQALGKY